ncbi:ABC transporter permease [Nocardioides baekrokdamisoli]|uniref:ABC transporter permease n=1 Tax=Nocardioides baekrokdamisoli TaxID=1804624 RepID=A0A3G9IBP3_9ACTN|nr:ABC transporter permease [Nocardioides baekrokdamisoli]BBH15732.1 ABC transporter permease [Nocardioides baekrokdamisoli]
MSVIVAPLVRRLDTLGDFFRFAGRALASIFKRPFAWQEALVQAAILARVVMLPTALVAIPLGAVVALQVGSLTQQLGAESFSGAASVVAILREGAPMATALLLAGAGGSAICADFGARRIREEIDAMEVLGIDVIKRLVAPRLVGAILVSVAVTALVMGVGIGGGYFFNVVLQHGTSGVYVASFRALATLPDIWVSLAKGFVFGVIIAIVGSYKGLRAGGGPRGVGQAVNESVITSFLLVFGANYLLSVAYFQLVPPNA